MAFLDKVQPYAVIDLDLTDTRSVDPYGAVTTSTGQVLNTWLANQLLVNAIDTGATLSVGVQDGCLTGGMITATAGLKINDISFNNVFFSHAAQPGKTAQILLAYID